MKATGQLNRWLTLKALGWDQGPGIAPPVPCSKQHGQGDLAQFEVHQSRGHHQHACPLPLKQLSNPVHHHPSSSPPVHAARQSAGRQPRPEPALAGPPALHRAAAPHAWPGNPCPQHPANRKTVAAGIGNNPRAALCPRNEGWANFSTRLSHQSIDENMQRINPPAGTPGWCKSAAAARYCLGTHPAAWMARAVVASRECQSRHSSSCHAGRGAMPWCQQP